ncbi:hypothetical protein D3C71_1794250 [compost metagenome]
MKVLSYGGYPTCHIAGEKEADWKGDVQAYCGTHLNLPFGGRGHFVDITEITCKRCLKKHAREVESK